MKEVSSWENHLRFGDFDVSEEFALSNEVWRKKITVRLIALLL